MPRKKNVKSKKKKQAAHQPAQEPAAIPDPKPEAQKPLPEILETDSSPVPEPAPKQKQDALRPRTGILCINSPEELPGGSKQYTINVPAAMSLKDLFDAIRKEWPSVSGSLYIIIKQNGPGMSYTYENGLFIRNEKLSDKNAKKAPLLADLLDVKIKTITMMETEGSLSWTASLIN